jgi:quinone-modifying oxidoreductase subunit QmoC
METAERTFPVEDAAEAKKNPEIPPGDSGKAVSIEPDLDFIRVLSTQGAASFKKCFQCGTCSATCPISPTVNPFPRKEMAWASWGMRDRLLRDPDVWLCHHCNDCSTRCPRGGRPGDLLALIRREVVVHYAVPGFLARWVNDPKMAPLLLAIPAILLGLALIVRDPLQNALGIGGNAGEKITFSFSSVYPHWLLNSLFGFFGILAVLGAFVGVARFWRAIKEDRPDQMSAPAKGLGASITSALKKAISHENFTSCTTAQARYPAHLGVFFGFLALSLVTIWVITAKFNPLISSDFVYPFSFWSPWKILANLGGFALLLGCSWMISDRLEFSDNAGESNYFDWIFIWTLFLVVVTGFVTEVMHFLRLEPHRHVAYFIHLVFVFTILIYLPYSKFAHVIYRTTAMVFAEHTGRSWGVSATAASVSRVNGSDGEEDIGNGEA